MNMTNKIISKITDITFCLSQCQDRSCSRNMDSDMYKKAMRKDRQVICAELAGGCEDFTKEGRT